MRLVTFSAASLHALPEEYRHPEPATFEINHPAYAASVLVCTSSNQSDDFSDMEVGYMLPHYGMNSTGVKLHEIKIFSLDRFDHHVFLNKEISRSVDIEGVALALFYAIVGLFGVFGNLRVISIILKRLLFTRTGAVSRPHPHANLYFYVLALSIVDSLVLVFLPVVITDIVMGQWTFGQLMCRMFWSCESLNKILSTFILVALSANCYVGVCRPGEYRKWKSVKVSILLVSISAGLSGVMMIPIFIYSEVFGVGYVVNETVHVFTVKCIFQPPQAIMTWFTFYTVGGAFCLTGIVQVVFYSLLLGFLYRHRRNLMSGAAQSSIPYWSVVKTVMLLVAFYFVCWTPYWIITLYTYFSSLNGHAIVDKKVIYFVHALPYVNAAVNPTLYSKFLRRGNSNDSAYSSIRSTTNGNGAVSPSDPYDEFGPISCLGEWFPTAARCLNRQASASTEGTARCPTHQSLITASSSAQQSTGTPAPLAKKPATFYGETDI